MGWDSGSGVGPRRDGPASPSTGEITIYIALLCLRIMYVHMLNLQICANIKLHLYNSRCAMYIQTLNSCILFRKYSLSSLFLSHFFSLCLDVTENIARGKIEERGKVGG